MLVKIPLGPAREHCEALRAAGFLTAEPDDEGDLVYAQTLTGSALAMVRFVKPMTRGVAEHLLDGVIQRAEEYNAGPARLLWVDVIIVFGSYLDPDAGELGDLDLCVRHSHREPDPSVYQRLADDYARTSGRSFGGNWLRRTFWPDIELKQILKKRSPRISIMDNEPEQLTDRWKVVYRREPRLVDTTIDLNREGWRPAP